MKTRIISFLAVLVLLLTLLPAMPASAEAKSGKCGENLTWTLDDGTLTISGTGPMTDFPSWEQRPWQTDYFFIQKVVLEPGLTSIGDYAFSQFTSLNAPVTIPDTVKRIGRSAFENGGLAEVTIPDGVTEIGNNAFASCIGLRSLELPDSVTSIGSAAFSGTALTEFNLPKNVTKLEDYLYESCHSLTSAAIPDGVTSIGKGVFYNCTGLKEVTIPNSVKSIGDQAFFGSGITSITFPDGVTSMGNEICSDCGSLTSFKLSKGATRIGDAMFKGCGSLTEVTIPEGVKTIGKHAFWVCGSLARVTLPQSLTSIGDGAFSNCTKLAEITIPENVTSIGERAFEFCGKLQKADIRGSVKSFGYRAFAECGSLQLVTLAKGVEEIGNSAFSDCDDLRGVTIPEGVRTIGDNAFDGCTSLQVVTVPASVTSIGKYAFMNCSGLTSATILNGVTSMGEGVFANCGKLANVKLSDNLTELGMGAFSRCGSLKDVTIPKGVTTISYQAFYQCGSLESITLPAGLTEVYGDAFSSCYKLQTIYFGGNLAQWNAITVYSEYSNLPFKNANVRYFATDTTPRQSVSFDGGEALGSMPTQLVKRGASFTLPDVGFFFPEGSMFDHWDVNGTAYQPGDSFTVYGDVTVKLVWTHQHKLVLTPANGPFCTEKGNIEYFTCSICGRVFKDPACREEITLADTVLAPIGHDWGAWTVTKAAAENAWGEEARTCSRCGAGETREVPPIGWEAPFTDVTDAAYFYKPVLWAFNHDPQVTTGTSATTFGPNNPCTRAQVVTFLWRAMGCPEPETSECPFTDVAEGAYYYKPVLWAVENGVTNGMSATLFGSDDTCTRGQIVTFLWRAMSKPEPSTTACPFEDVSETAWFYQPVLWAVENGVTNGVDASRFGPDATCTRGQVVTFLYRAIEN